MPIRAQDGNLIWSSGSLVCAIVVNLMECRHSKSTATTKVESRRLQVHHDTLKMILKGPCIRLLAPFTHQWMQTYDLSGWLEFKFFNITEASLLESTLTKCRKNAWRGARRAIGGSIRTCDLPCHLLSKYRWLRRRRLAGEQGRALATGQLSLETKLLYWIVCSWMTLNNSDIVCFSSYSHINTFGRIGRHNVVVACLPKGKYGITSAASVAKDMYR